MRYIKNLLVAELLWLVATLIMSLPSFLVGGVLYPTLLEWLPSLFHEINPVIDPEGFEAMERSIALISATLTVLVISYLTVRFDNERMEYIISKTDGFFRRSEGCAIYYPRYLASDIIVAALVPLPLFIGSIFLPSEIVDYLVTPIELLFGFTNAFIDSLGLIFGYCYASLAFFISRLLFGFTSLSAWRGIWLADIY